MRLRLCFSGAAAGVVGGLFGAGGGMVLIPLLISLCHLEPRCAFASSLSIILPITIVSLITSAMNFGLPFQEAIPYLIGGTVGGIFAGIFYRKIPTGILRRVMALLILWGGIRILWH